MSRKKNAVVIGGANVDISGTPYRPLIERDSNPGKTTVSLGGVGRNIAENLSRLGVPTELVTVLGGDGYSQQICESCKENRIGLKYADRLPAERTSTYLCINDATGDMRLAVSDMEIYRHMTPTFLEERMEFLNQCGVCVADTNIPAETLAYLMDTCQVPIFIDPVSVQKSEKLKPILHNVTALKPNILEAQVLTGIKMQSPESLDQMADKLHERDVKFVFISLGKDGVYYSDGEQKGIEPCFPCPVVNTTGAGDSFFAAAAYCYLHGGSVLDMARTGLAAAAICIGDGHTVSKSMSETAVHELFLQRTFQQNFPPIVE